MRRHLFAVLAAGLLACAGAARANDSTARLDLGGLVLTQNSDIRMDEEKLYLSRGEVQVEYLFTNTSSRPISTLVAFPLPPIELGPDTNYDLPVDDPVNVVGFEVNVDGRPVTPSVDARATRFGLDMTGVLRSHGIPVTPSAGDVARIEALPEPAKAQLECYGLVDWSSAWGADDRPVADVHWTAHVAFYWFQEFPAGRTIRVAHRYRPVPGQFFFSRHELQDPEFRERFCMDDAFARAAERRLAGAGNELLMAADLGYVLVTANNWLGPIGRFELTVDKGSPDALVSFCGEDVRKIGPTTFRMEKRDFSPEEDLRVLFLWPPR